MNNANKYIWSTYILLWVYFLFFDTSYDQSSHIGSYLLFGWIPFLVASKIWKSNNQVVVQNSPSPESSDTLSEYNLLFQITDKEKFLKIFQAGQDAKILLEDNKKRLQAFGERINKDPEQINNEQSEYFMLNPEEMTEYEEIKYTISEFKLTSDFVDEYINILEEINNKLNKGLSLNTAKTLLDEKLKDIYERRESAKANLIMARVTGEELIKSIAALKKRKPDATLKEINALKIDGTELQKKIKEEVEKEFGIKLNK